MAPSTPHPRFQAKARSVATALGAGLGARATVALGIVSFAAGMLIGTSVAAARDSGRAEMGLTGMVQQRQDSVEQLEQEVGELDQRAQQLIEGALPTAIAAPPRALSRLPVSGPGLTVTLSDAASEFVPDEGTNVNDMVVHQQDVDAVINALWRGGAEAIAVQGVRLAADTPVRCVGSVILVGSRSYAPPYRIEAIGDVRAMADSLDADERVSLYRADAARYQMGWDVQTQQALSLPAATEIRTPKLATPISAP